MRVDATAGNDDLRTGTGVGPPDLLDVDAVAVADAQAILSVPEALGA